MSPSHVVKNTQPLRREPLVVVADEGLYCPPGDFYIDPWRAVRRAWITHGHSDHARWGHQQYVVTPGTEPIVRHRLGKNLDLQGIPYGEVVNEGPVKVSFHSAGHVLGSAQIRLEYEGEVWVVTGDYKRGADPTCAPFEVVPCDVLITEATFGLPIYRWDSGEVVARQIREWWLQNRSEGRTSLLFGYALGKAQRILAELAQLTDETVYLHGAMVPMDAIYREAGVVMVPTEPVSVQPKGYDFAGDLVIAPPSGFRSAWMKRFKKMETAFASGWMRIRGNRRRRGYDRGFVLSDHADWPELLQTVRDSGARKVLATHGQTSTLVRYLQEQGIDAAPLKTEYTGEVLDEGAEEEPAS